MANRQNQASAQRGGLGPFNGAGAPANGTTNVQTVTVTGSPGGGTFKLSFRNQVTAAIAYGAAASAVQTALRALSTIGSGGCSVSGSSGGPWTVTFSGALDKKNLPLLVLAVNSLTGGTNPSVTIANATAGVNAFGRDVAGLGPAIGALYIDTTNGRVYQNVGTQQIPVWVETGSRVARVALGAGASGGGILSWQNPLPVDVAILRLLIDLTTAASGACTADFGTTASSATTSSNNLLTGLDMNAATGLFDNLANPGGSGKAIQRLAAGKWVTGSKASGTATGIVGVAYIHYMPLGA